VQIPKGEEIPLKKTQQLLPQRILDISRNYMPAIALMTANKLGVFSELSKGPLDAKALGERLKLHPRGARDFFDGLVSLGLLVRRDGFYSNAPDTDLFLDRAKPFVYGRSFGI
jgi:Dimerisation domain